MDFELLGTLGWREGLLTIIALLVIYIAVIFVRMRRLQQKLRAATVLPQVAQSAVAAYAAIQEPPPAIPALEPAVCAVPEPVASAPEFPWNEPPPETAGQALSEALQQEVDQLRCEVDELRAEVLAAREDFRRQLAQSDGSVQGASPLYNDAMQMAVQGHDATAIAHHCSISRAEADLVVALARNRNEGI